MATRAELQAAVDRVAALAGGDLPDVICWTSFAEFCRDMEHVPADQRFFGAMYLDPNGALVFVPEDLAVVTRAVVEGRD